MREALHGAAADAVALAKAAGADEARATASHSRSVSFQVRDGALEKVEDSTSQAVGVRVWVDGRSSSHDTTDLRPDRLRAFIEEAVALTRSLQPDPDRAIPDPALYAGRSDLDLDLVDAAVLQLGRDARLAACLEQNDVARQHAQVISATSWMSDSHTRGAVAASNGLAGDWASTSAWVGTEVTVKDGPDKKPEAGFYAGGHHLDGLPGRVDVGKRALERALVRIGESKGPTKKTLMVVDPSVASSLLHRLLRPAAGFSVHQGRSFYAGRVGEQLVSEKLTVTDDPLLPRGLASRRFDGEGIAAGPLPILVGGRLENLYLDTTYARKLGMAPTTGGPSNRTVAPGARDVAAILADIDDAIYVTGWLGGNSDETTGDFSLGCRGHAVVGGEIGPAIGEMNVTGNLLSLFAALVEVGSDPWPYSSLRAPTLVFDGVQFAGA